ncbi:hypothetical protein [Staphylococcus pseudintermedius]|uniref:hypothetical protein n=1 Tax=Staphylococcus pseudintermedius TaxID=283734 RepID=UPI001F317513|nr:hypothetical protein [Staphylococcus pseudintermedius]
MIDETGQVKHLHVTSDQPYADHSIIKVSNYLSANVRQFFDGNDVQSIESRFTRIWPTQYGYVIN